MSDTYKSRFGGAPATAGKVPCSLCGKPGADPQTCPYYRTQVDAQATMQGAAGMQAGVQIPNGGVGMGASYPMPQAQWGAQVTVPQVAMPQFQYGYGVPAGPPVATQVVPPQPQPGYATPGAQVQTFTPGDNPYAAGVGVARQKSMHWGIKLALTGGIFGTLLLFGLYFFYEWRNGRLEWGSNKPNTPAVVFPPSTPGGGTSLYPGLPAQYLGGGFGWLAVPDLEVVYVAHDATAVQTTQANAYAAEHGFQVRYVMEDAGTIGGGAGGTPGDLRSALREIQSAAKELRDNVHDKRHRFTTSEYSGAGGLKSDLDELMSDIDKAVGMTGGD